MEEAPENGKESSNSAHANGMDEWMNGWMNDQIIVRNFEEEIEASHFT